MLVVLKETYCNKVNIHITQRDDFIKKKHVQFILVLHVSAVVARHHQAL